jgi:putative NADH-flavin reductase
MTLRNNKHTRVPRIQNIEGQHFHHPSHPHRTTTKMPTYAILGATGQVGSSILDSLLQQESPLKSKANTKDPISIRAFVRSKQRLLTMRPALPSHPNTTIHEGQITSTTLLASCIANTRAVFLCVAATENVPYCSIAQETAHAVLAAMEEIGKSKSGDRLPEKLVVLSSASLEPHLMGDLPAPFRVVMHAAASYVYEDLRLAETYLRSNTPKGVELIFIKPGGLVHDKPVGHKLSTTHQETFLSFADLGAGMVEAADSATSAWAEAKGNVSVVPAKEGTRVEWYVPWFLVKGCLYHFFPAAYPYLVKVLP